MELLGRLQEIGIDTVHTLERFGGNEGLYIRFLNKFPADPNITQLKEAITARDYKTAQACAHTIKGVSANLGMGRLSDSCSELVSRLRADETEDLKELMDRLLSDYEKIIAVIEEP